jgi:hypothetical protein
MNSLQSAYNQFRNPATASTTGEAFYRMQNEKARKRQEEEARLRAMDLNTKTMSPEEKDRALNAFKNRRFRQFGIGHVPGEEFVGGKKRTESN